MKKEVRHPDKDDAGSLAQKSASEEAWNEPRHRPFTDQLRRRWKLIAGGSIVICFTLIAVFADFLAPYDYRAQSRGEPTAPPTRLHFYHSPSQSYTRPFIHPRQLVDRLDHRYQEETARSYPLELFTRGYPFKLFGILTVDRHLFGVGGEGAPRAYLLGTDPLGRDHLSRLVIATRFSLYVGLLGTLLTGLLGITLGGVAGIAGKWADVLLMRAADIMMALPKLVLILTVRAAFPLELPPARAAELLIIIFVALGWAEMALLTRSLIQELKSRDYVLAAISIGVSRTRLFRRHLLPNIAPSLLVTLFLMLPVFLLAEASLSFLGVGLQEPEVSWGKMLAAASDITLLQQGQTTVLLPPALAIALFVLGMRLLSDGVKKERGDDR